MIRASDGLNLALDFLPYDTRAEVWADPDNHHLPLRVRFSNGAHVLELQPAAQVDP